MKLYYSFIIGCVAIMLISFKTKKVMHLFRDYPVYRGNDLGVTYTPSKTVCKVWAPGASAVKLRLYLSGDGGKPVSTLDLQKAADGLWETTIHKNIRNQYYTFQVYQDGRWLLERPDIYARAVGVNGERGMILDEASTNPPKWNLDKRPALNNFTDIIIYELHLRDLSMDPNSGILHRGKYLGLTETGTKSPAGEKTGLDHIKELGVTHVHLLPTFDFNSIDETKPELNEYNWGYDPLNYNVPEGSYSSNPYIGNTRINEYKRMVQALHENGLRVILDVVYNHTTNTQSNFNQFAPLYFYRLNANGGYSDASGCGNETASEKEMMRKFMIESVVYWAKAYHIDGFRFDLMGIHDIETMNEISAALHAIDPTIFIYGEGWTAGASPLPEDLRAVKKNTFQLHQVAAFSDDIRDGLRGPFGNVHAKGFVSGDAGWKESVKFGIVASTQHAQVNYNAVNYSKAPWAAEPYQAINYVACHDDNTLFDRLKVANPGSSEAELVKMDKLSNAVVLTSQGVAFLQAGAEMLRTKQGVENSYRSPDSINQLDWGRKTQFKSVFNYYKGLVALRKNHPAFRMPVAEMIRTHLQFFDTGSHVIGYQITGNANHDTWKNIVVVFNGSADVQQVNIPAGNWTVVVDGDKVDEAGTRKISGGEIMVPGTTAYVLYKMD